MTTTAPERLALADDLEQLCCAETEGKFFDLVTDNIQTIIAALRVPAADRERIARAICDNITAHCDDERCQTWIDGVDEAIDAILSTGARR